MIFNDKRFAIPSSFQ